MWHDGLWRQLWQQGVRGKAWRILKALYSNLECSVLVDGERSRFSKIFQGVRQGCPLSPILFSCYINGLVKLLKGISGVTIGVRELCSLLYADDIVLMADSPEALQKMIDIVETYTSRWRLSLNTNKTKVMIVRSSRNAMIARDEHWSFRNQSLEVVREYKYLGVWFTDILL